MKRVMAGKVSVHWGLASGAKWETQFFPFGYGYINVYFNIKWNVAEWRECEF